MLVATTHLKAKISVANELLRENQVGQLLDAIQREAAQWPGSAIIFAGDHNADAYDVTDKGVTVPATCVPSVAASTDPVLKSVYPLPSSEADMYTTWKKRGAYEARHTIDYVWHSPHDLRPLSRLGVVAEAELEPWRLPGFRYPSDHLSLWARFELVGSGAKARAGSTSGGSSSSVKRKGKATSTIAVGFGLKRGGGAAAAGDAAPRRAGSGSSERRPSTSSPRQVVPDYLLEKRSDSQRSVKHPSLSNHVCTPTGAFLIPQHPASTRAYERGFFIFFLFFFSFFFGKLTTK